MEWETEARQYQSELTRHRQALHRIPELGYQETKTKSYILEELKKCNPDQIEMVLETGIKCVFYGTQKDRDAIAFRADMDALPIQEPEDCPYRSQHPGQMHACGHDGHMAMLLTLARVLSDHRESLSRNVVLLFQPAEETTGGADRMIRQGVLENPHVSEVYGMHMMPDVPLGKIAVVAGPIMASTCEIDLIFRGKASHGAYPHLGQDALAAAGYAITMLQSIVSRRINPIEPAVLTLGKMTAGTQRNILADTARIEGIIRTYSNDVYDQIEACIKDILAGTERAFHVETEIEKHVFYPSTCNDPEKVEKVKRILQDRYMQAVPRMTAEDFSYFLLARPGAFLFCGCMDEQHHSPLHSPEFGFDEEALVYGLAADIGLIMEDN